MKFARSLVLISFVIPVLWYLIFFYTIDPNIPSDNVYGSAYTFALGFFVSFIVMVGFDTIGSIIMGWILIKNVEQRTKFNIGVLIIGVLSCFASVSILSHI
ncbi:MAG: hypothetical protein GY710_23895 [Desulfobacteraceae bacterium]|nr:hypothetical protein [Desulfobacteraceae bacterium]